MSIFQSEVKSENLKGKFKMSAKIKTTGQLRDFLANMMLGIKNGDLDLDKARNLVKMAGQINESMYAEIKVAKVRLEAGEQVEKMGALPIGEKDE